MDIDIYKEIKIDSCPFCGGTGVLEEENGNGWYIICADCGSQTATFDFKKAEDRVEAAETAARIWNMGKVSKMGAGE